MSDTIALRPIIRLLVVHEDLEQLSRICESLAQHPHIHAHGQRDPGDAAEALRSGSFDGIVADERVLEHGDIRHCTVPVVAISSCPQGQSEGRIEIRGMAAQPEPADLAERVLEAYARQRAERRRETLARWLERESCLDHVTGLYNRQTFDERLAESAARAAASSGELSLVVADVPGLSTLNRIHGYGAGDEVLRHVGTCVARSIRAADTAARVCGDSVGIILPDSGVDVARMVARRIDREVERDAGADLPPISLTFSLATGRGEDAGSLILAALAQLDEGRSHLPPLAIIGRPERNPGPGVA